MAEPDVTLTGTLQGGVAAIGGETTGYQLNGVTIEVDVAEVEDSDQMDGQQVSVEGHFETREGVESGARWVFKAHSARQDY